MGKKIKVLELGIIRVHNPWFDVGGDYEILSEDSTKFFLKTKDGGGVLITKNGSRVLSKWEYVNEDAEDAAKWRKLEALIEHTQGDDCPTKLSFLIRDTLERTLELVTGKYSELTQAVLDKKQLTHGRMKVSQISLYDVPRSYGIIEPESPHQKAILEAREESERAAAKLKALEESYNLRR